MAPQPPASNGGSKRRRIAGESKPGEKAPAPTPPRTVRRPVTRPGVPRTPETSPAPPVQRAPRKPEKKVTEKKETDKVAPSQAAPEQAAPVAAPAPPVASDRVADVLVPRSRASLKDLAPLLVCALLAVVLGVLGGGWGLVSWQKDHGIDSAHAAAADAAADAVETAFTYDYTSLDAHLKKAQKLMTPSFAKEFAKITPALDQLAPQRQIQIKAESRDAAPIPCGTKCDRDKAQVLVFLDQARRTKDAQTPTTFGSRIRVSMVHEDGRWLVNNITAL